ncbi:hypothetical protein OED52_10525 [Rhodococcus sp. Z13]|uniref:Uncharacterized protein n=1 Tax=Rhodococcus sacchari TaxID=2962047 RepID=A0ACD4DB34_9NOCA|nr:hypothetical protein [Rhodococcus sp. Z13]UYP17172.1 hypothetical protein OED52_10525 [Rhodococcus sp. Z13]
MDESGAGSGTASWDGMVEWLVESLTGRPTGFVLDVGPSDYAPSEDDPDDVVCAQVHVLDDGVLLLRRSRTELDQLLLADHSPAGLVLDHWHTDTFFPDCTDGYLFSRDVRLIAEACVAWFRMDPSIDTTEQLGCSYRFPDALPRGVLEETDADDRRP